MLVLSILAAVVILVGLVPSLTSIFRTAGAELPLATRILVNASVFLRLRWPWLLAGLFAVGCLAAVICSRESVRVWLSALQLRLPAVGRLITARDANQFAAILSTLLQAGLPMDQALRVVSRTLKNRVLAREAASCIQGIEQGRELSACLRTCPHFPGLLAEMAGVGEQTASMPRLFDTAAAYFENEISNRSDRLVRILEPVSILFAAAMVLFLLLAVYSPILSLYSALG